MQNAAEGAKLSGNRTVSGQNSGKCKKQTTDEAILRRIQAKGRDMKAVIRRRENLSGKKTEHRSI